MTIFKFASLVFVGLWIILFISNDVAFSQYNDPEINYAIRKLREWKLLDQVTLLAEQDRRQSATRADLLITCYQIIREMKRMNIYKVERDLDQLKLAVSELKTNPGSSNTIPSTTESLLIQRTLNKVESNLSNMQPVKNLEKETNDLQAKVNALKKYLEKEDVSDVKKLDRKIKHNTIIASMAVLSSLAITILAAR